ncbi:MAG: fibronectin type III domain-containing protein [Planctomycetes bacterium]|nr:fibronectin type III domain-containing protein [Planctomycetota bacterium]
MFLQLIAQEQAKQAYRVATQETNGAFAALRATAGDDVRLIRAYAESQSKPEVVYNTAQIPPPAAPTPIPPPGQPTDLTVTLAPSTGELTLRWKVTNPPGASGTSYIIRRRLPGESEFHNAPTLPDAFRERGGKRNRQIEHPADKQHGQIAQNATCP